VSQSPRAKYGHGIRAKIGAAVAGDVLWVQSSRPICGYSKTGRTLKQEGFWAVSKKTGERVDIFRITILAVRYRARKSRVLA